MGGFHLDQEQNILFQLDAESQNEIQALCKPKLRDRKRQKCDGKNVLFQKRNPNLVISSSEFHRKIDAQVISQHSAMQLFGKHPKLLSGGINGILIGRWVTGPK